MELIKEGQIWRQRNGALVEITAIVLDDPMPVKAGDRCWQTNGRYWNDVTDNRSDLVELVVSKDVDT